MAEQEIIVKKKSQFRDVLHRFLKNKAAVISLFFILLLIICAIFPEQIAPYSYSQQNYSETFISPCLAHPFGTDNYGRDILSRVIYGTRISIGIGLVAVALSCVFGIVIGAAAGFYGSTTDNIIMRIIDIMLAIPSILLMMAIVTALGNGAVNLTIAIAISSVPGYARIVRASVMTEKELEYIEAARSSGATDLKIIMRHILPNCLAPIIVQATMSIATAILSIASLSFVGLGISPPTPEWGSMLNDAQSFMRDHWFVVTFPGLMIMLTVFAFNLLGDGLRDALDPKLKT
ncbi:MAG: ABC transporter permease [Oscillospiraceae bacterium]|nr:ABC transporter permease [Oscillospiraceae bacterium]